MATLINKNEIIANVQSLLVKDDVMWVAVCVVSGTPNEFHVDTVTVGTLTAPILSVAYGRVGKLFIELLNRFPICMRQRIADEMIKQTLKALGAI